MKIFSWEAVNHPEAIVGRILTWCFFSGLQLWQFCDLEQGLNIDFILGQVVQLLSYTGAHQNLYHASPSSVFFQNSAPVVKISQSYAKRDMQKEMINREHFLCNSATAVELSFKMRAMLEGPWGTLRCRRALFAVLWASLWMCHEWETWWQLPSRMTCSEQVLTGKILIKCSSFQPFILLLESCRLVCCHKHRRQNFVDV